MKNIAYALQAVKDCLLNHIAEFIPENNLFDVSIPTISKDNIVVDFPDIDKLPNSTMIYIVPDYSAQQPQTTCTQLNDDYIKVWLFCKRDKQENLVARVTTISSAIMQTILNYRTLDNKVNLCDFQSSDFYPAVTATSIISAVEITLDVKYVLHV